MNPARNLDASYLRELGPAAWPALARARKANAVTLTIEGGQGAVWDEVQQEERTQSRTRLDAGHWREFGLRAWWNREALGK